MWAPKDIDGNLKVLAAADKAPETPIFRLERSRGKKGMKAGTESKVGKGSNQDQTNMWLAMLRRNFFSHSQVRRLFC